MVDNSYLNWSATMLPMKNAATHECIRFSEWIESAKKDVE